MTPSCCGACDTERAVSAILINVRCPKPEEAEGFMRSGAEPEWPEEMKAQHRRLWPLLSSQEQQLLAWRAKHFGKHQLSEFCPPEAPSWLCRAKPPKQMRRILGKPTGGVTALVYQVEKMPDYTLILKHATMFTLSETPLGID